VPLAPPHAGTARVRPTRSLLVASLCGIAALALLVALLVRDETRVSLPALGVLLLTLGAASGLVALDQPRVPLTSALVYVGSPLSFFIVFRHTSSAFAYPAAADLALDATVALGLLAGSIVPLARRGGLSLRGNRDQLLLPLGALAAVWLVSGLVGILRGNPPRYVATDLIPVAELVLAYLAASRLYGRALQARPLAVFTVGSLTLTALVRLSFYPFGTRGFGVTQQGIGSLVLPRLFLVQPFAWIAPLCVVYALTARTRRSRLLGVALAVLFAICVLVSFERGTWTMLGGATLPLLAVVLWKRPRVALAAGAAVLLGSVALAAAGKGSYNPVALVVHRLAYTRTQVFDPNEPLQNKRSDEARAIARTIHDHPAYWPAGGGLGATYVGPTGFHNAGYRSSFKPKHYSFNTYLAVALRSGLLGLAALTLVIVGMLRVSWRAARSTEDRRLSLAGAAVVGGTVALIIVSVVDPELLIHPLALYLGATFGLLTRKLRRDQIGTAEPTC
jgi:hypothetical protein